MVNLTINQKKAEVQKGMTILEAAESVGVMIPHLCYLKDINEIGACRVCVVEVEGKDSLVAACNTIAEEGMVVSTNSPKAHAARKMNVELILSQHDYRCATCVRNGNCGLQNVAAEMNILEVPYQEEIEKSDWNQNIPLIRNSAKCIKCMRCVQICDKVQGMNIWGIVNTGRRTSVNVSGGRKMEDSDCSLCGQCITHCPTGALRERDDIQKVVRAIEDEDKIVIVQIAPAVRTAWAEGLGLPLEKATVKKLVAALRNLGCDYVFDTNFSADLTIMEEATELLERIGKRQEYDFPMFTSCCPGWVRFVKSRYPEYVKNLSTAKSPQQMFGAIAKTYYADLLGVEADRIFSVSIMPCTAKKEEAAIPVMNAGETGLDVDAVLTTREVARFIRSAQLKLDELEEEAFDIPLGIGSGAGVIFGVTGGVMEAALRSAYYFLYKENPHPDAFHVVRGQNGIREVSVDMKGTVLKAAVISGLSNAKAFMEELKKGEKQYDFVEIMACPGGCSGGGGQPIWDGKEMAKERGDKLYQLDKQSELRFSHENPSITQIYKEYLNEPMSEKAHHLLHVDHESYKLNF